MIICGGELEAADGRIARTRQKERDRWTIASLEEEVDGDVNVDDETPYSEEDEAEDDAQENILSCLQIDLRKFGLGQS